MPRLSFTVELDDETAAAFHDIATTRRGQTGNALVEQLINDFVQLKSEDAEYDAWFREQAEDALVELNVPNAKTYGHDEAMAVMWSTLEAKIATANGGS